MDRVDMKELEPTVLDIAALMTAEDNVIPKVSADEDPTTGAFIVHFAFETDFRLFATEELVARAETVDDVREEMYEAYLKLARDAGKYLRAWADEIDRKAIAVRDMRAQERRGRR